MSKRREADIRDFFGAKKRTAEGSQDDSQEQAGGDQVNNEQAGPSSREDTDGCREFDVSAVEEVPVIEAERQREGEAVKADKQNECTGRERTLSGDPTEPYQPNPREIAPQELSNRILHFQEKWFKDFQWLHYDPMLKGVLCFHCMQTFDDRNAAFNAKIDPAFVTVGFKNWKKAIEKFKAHASTHAHCHSVSVSLHKGKSIETKLSNALEKQQEENRHCFNEVVSAVKFLARQGIAFRGHEKEEGNINQLLKHKSETDTILLNWLEKRSHDYLSPQTQNEILQLLGNAVVRNIVAAIKAQDVVQFSIIIDGTQDVSGTEQESICLRYVDHDLVPHEEFVGLYQTASTTGESICAIAIDALKRMHLPLSCLRGQAYDGAANMAGKNLGVQALIKKHQPLALYVHCGAHCINLATEAACKSSPLIRDSLQWVHELGNLFNQSGKFKTVFEKIAKSSENAQYKTLKPLCPTRWTVRHKAIASVIDQYASVLDSLEEMALGTADTATKANGLLDRFRAGTTVLGLLLGSEVTGELECLNRSLQMRTQTAGGMRAAVDCVKSTLQNKRDERAFQELFTKAEEMVTSLNIREILVPRLRKPPKRFCGEADMHLPDTAVDYYRAEYFRMLDTVDVQLKVRFDQESMVVIQKLEEVLLTGQIDATLVDQYPELDRHALQAELPMFRAKHKYKSCVEAANILQQVPEEVRSLFQGVETLIRLLLVMPASSAEAERSFSALRRLKTWLRSTIGQGRLNQVALCHIHKAKLDLVDRKKICQEFVAFSDRRKKVFGTF